MTGYQCWFCDQGIERADANAVIINVESLWRWVDAALMNDNPSQSIYAHSLCAKDRLTGGRLRRRPQNFGNDN